MGIVAGHFLACLLYGLKPRAKFYYFSLISPAYDCVYIRFEVSYIGFNTYYMGLKNDYTHVLYRLYLI